MLPSARSASADQLIRAEDVQVHRQVPVAHQQSLGEQHQHAHHRSADERVAPARQRESPHEVIGGEEEPDEERGDEPREQPQKGVEDQQLPLQRVAVLHRDGEGGVVAEEDVGHHRRDDARHHDRGEGAHRQGSEDLLQGEEGPRQRRVECGRDPGRGAGADQHLGAGRDRSGRRSPARSRSPTRARRRAPRSRRRPRRRA